MIHTLWSVDFLESSVSVGMLRWTRRHPGILRHTQLLHRLQTQGETKSAVNWASWLVFARMKKNTYKPRNASFLMDHKHGRIPSYVNCDQSCLCTRFVYHACSLSAPATMWRSERWLNARRGQGQPKSSDSRKQMDSVWKSKRIDERQNVINHYIL